MRRASWPMVTVKIDEWLIQHDDVGLEIRMGVKISPIASSDQSEVLAYFIPGSHIAGAGVGGRWASRPEAIHDSCDDQNWLRFPARPQLREVPCRDQQEVGYNGLQGGLHCTFWRQALRFTGSFPRAMASRSPGHASRTILHSRLASSRSPRSSASAARLRKVRWP